MFLLPAPLTAAPPSLLCLLQTALCMHNVAFQGRFWADSFPQLGLPQSSFSKFEFTDGYPKIFDETSPAEESGAVSRNSAARQCSCLGMRCNA